MLWQRGHLLLQFIFAEAITILWRRGLFRRQLVLPPAWNALHQSRFSLGRRMHRQQTACRDLDQTGLTVDSLAFYRISPVPTLENDSLHLARDASRPLHPFCEKAGLR